MKNAAKNYAQADNDIPKKTLQCIVIDGPAGVGKSTLARLLSLRLDIPNLNTGAMFRSIALLLGSENANMPDDRLAEKLASLRFDLLGKGDNTVLMLNNKPAGKEIYTEQVAALASLYACKKPLRLALKKAQREIAAKGPFVAEGRDLGTAVFPDAQFKFFLDATPKARALRRWKELNEKGTAAALDELETALAKRDEQDRNRPIDPLKAADDAMVIDTSLLGIEDVLAKMLEQIYKKGWRA